MKGGLLEAAPQSALARLLVAGETLEAGAARREIPEAFLSALADLGLLTVADGSVTAGEFRLVNHLGLALFVHKVTPRAKLYYGNDSVALSERLPPVEGAALDLCCGAGAQTLVCALTADSVTGVDREPLAGEVLAINAALNGLSPRVEFLLGDFLEPVAGRRFDRIVSNPPFMPVPPGIPYPLFAGGGPDGLELVARLLAALPEMLKPEGRCQIVGAVLGTEDGPDQTVFRSLAEQARLELEISCPTCEELEGDTLQSFVRTTTLTGDGVERVFRDHFAGLGATHLYCYLLSAARAPRASVTVSHHDGDCTTVWMSRR